MANRMGARARLLACMAVAAIGGCASRPAHQVDLPQELGTPTTVAALEVPAGALAEGETATFDVEFEVGPRGNVERSAVRSTTRPDLQDAILEQHRLWRYAAATRERPCVATRFTAVQRLVFGRKDGRLSMELEPARVEQRLQSVAAEWNGNMSLLKPESILGPVYPREALLDHVEGTVGVMFEFGPDGKARDARLLNVAPDRWGVTRAALGTAMRYENA